MKPIVGSMESDTDKTEALAQCELSGDSKCIELASRVMRALSHPLRMKILCLFGNREFAVQNIMDVFGASQSNISIHLSVLLRNGVLLTRRDERRIFYRVGDARISKLICMMRDVFCCFPR